MHPVGWLVWAAGAGITTATTTNPFYLVPLVACAYVVHAFHRSDRSNAPSFRIFAIFALVTLCMRTLLVVFGGSLAAAFVEGARLAVLLIVFGAFNSVADPLRILRLAPSRFHEAALSAALALSIAPRTIAAVAQVRDAQRLRGIGVSNWRAIPALAVPVLETGMEDALTLAESMDARGHGRGRRTRYRPDRWDAPSAAATAACAAAASAFLASYVTGDPTLSMPLFPLAWPDASPVLLVAALTFAVPVMVPNGSDA